MIRRVSASVVLRGLLLVAVCGALAWEPVRADHSPGVFGGGSGGPINTIPGMLLEKGGVVLSYRYDCLDLRRFSDQQLLDFDAAGLEGHSTDATLIQFATLAYGLTDQLTVAIRQPHIAQINIRELDHHGGGDVDALGSSSGFGDTQLFGFQRLYHNDDRKVYVSFLFGLDIPTGTTNNLTSHGGDHLFETEHQPGSGSLDPILGLNFTKNFENCSFHGNVSRIFNTLGSQQTTLGSVFNYNFAFVYRISRKNFRPLGYYSSAAAGDDYGDNVVPVSWHDEDQHGHGGSMHDHGHSGHGHGGCMGPALDLICELNGIGQNRNVVAGVFDDSSGGDLIYVSPGVRLTLFDHWSSFIQGGFPIYQRVNGANHKVDSRLTLGTSYFY